MVGSVDGLLILLIMSGLIAARLGLNAGEGRGRSSSDVEGVTGNRASCESGLEGNDEDIGGGGDTQHGERERGDIDEGGGVGIGLGGNGKLKSTFVNVTTTSSEISSKVDIFRFKFVGDASLSARARRLCALVVVLTLIGDRGIAATRGGGKEW